MRSGRVGRTGYHFPAGGVDAGRREGVGQPDTRARRQETRRHGFQCIGGKNNLRAQLASPSTITQYTQTESQYTRTENRPGISARHSTLTITQVQGISSLKPLDPSHHYANAIQSAYSGKFSQVSHQGARRSRRLRSRNVTPIRGRPLGIASWGRKCRCHRRQILGVMSAHAVAPDSLGSYLGCFDPEWLILEFLSLRARVLEVRGRKRARQRIGSGFRSVLGIFLTCPGVRGHRNLGASSSN